jgi:hypothetical protein
MIDRCSRKKKSQKKFGDVFFSLSIRRTDFETRSIDRSMHACSSGKNQTIFGGLFLLGYRSICVSDLSVRLFCSCFSAERPRDSVSLLLWLLHIEIVANVERLNGLGV